MCGRYTLHTPAADLRDFFELAAEPVVAPRYNVAPSQDVPVVRLSDGERTWEPLRWGFVPRWADDPKSGNRPINARSETAAGSRLFGTAFKARRCLIPADGFYEWSKPGRVPHYFRPTDERPFAFAGLWERWEKGSEPLETFTLLTRSPYSAVAPVHDRSPLILPRGLHAAWLGAENGREASGVLEAVGDIDLLAHAVSRAVNHPKHDGPELIEPAGG